MMNVAGGVRAWWLLWRQWGASPSLLTVPAVVGQRTSQGMRNLKFSSMQRGLLFQKKFPNNVCVPTVLTSLVSWSVLLLPRFFLIIVVIFYRLLLFSCFFFADMKILASIRSILHNRVPKFGPAYANVIRQSKNYCVSCKKYLMMLWE